MTGAWAAPALCLAAVLAAFNALSSAELAASHPVSGGTYAYGYRYLGPDFGFCAGFAFLLAKSASAAAAAIGLSGYVLAGLGMDPALTNPVASSSKRRRSSSWPSLAMAVSQCWARRSGAPRRTIPRAIILTLLVSTCLYL